MPVYEYLCEKCDHEFEREQRISDDPVRTCPNCRSRKVKRLISKTAFVLKGGGWYSEGYASAKTDSKSGADTDSASKGAEPATSSDSSAKSDSDSSKKTGGDGPAKSKGKKSAA